MEKDIAVLVVFTLAEQQFALPVGMVAQVVRAVAITPLPKAPAIVQGMLDFHGTIVPVMDIRRRLGLPSRPLSLSNQIVIANTPNRRFAFVVENIAGVATWGGAGFVAAPALVPGVEFLDGVVRNEEGLILVYDPDAFFLPEEHLMLDHAVDQASIHG